MRGRLMRSEQGDTIVEVLVAIAVVSLILVGAYVSTRQSLTTVQDTQEHSEALQLAQTQIELLHSKHSAPATGGCFYQDGSGHNPGDPDCTVDATGAKGDKYTVAVTSGTAAGGLTTYTIQVSWDSLTHSGHDNVTLYYQDYEPS